MQSSTLASGSPITQMRSEPLAMRTEGDQSRERQVKIAGGRSRTTAPVPTSLEGIEMSIARAYSPLRRKDAAADTDVEKTCRLHLNADSQSAADLGNPALSEVSGSVD